MIWPLLLGLAGGDRADAVEDDDGADGRSQAAGSSDGAADDDRTDREPRDEGERAPADGRDRPREGEPEPAPKRPDPRRRRIDPAHRPERPSRALDAQVQEAQRKLREAMEKNQAEQPRRTPQVGQKVDKYFGEKLPPVCERLGCYLTDDGKRFYCVNATCQKHRKRDTKHTRIAKRPRGGPTYFRCPRCDSRHIDLLMFTDQYECRRCGHTWDRDTPKPAEKE